MLTSACWHCNAPHRRIGPVLCLACDAKPDLHERYTRKRDAWMAEGAKAAREFAAIFPEPEPYWPDDLDDDVRHGTDLKPEPEKQPKPQTKPIEPDAEEER